MAGLETPLGDRRAGGERLTARCSQSSGSTRIRRFKLHLVAFVLGIPLLGGLWVLTEYREHTWPSRFASDPDVAGTWDPWLFFVAGVWLIIIVVHALKDVPGTASPGQ